MSEPPVTLEELRGVDLFDSLSDADLAEWVTLAHARRVQAGGIIVEQGEEPPWSATAARGPRTGADPRAGQKRAGRPSHRADLDGSDRRAHRRHARGAHAGRDRLPHGNGRARGLQAPGVRPAGDPPARDAPGRAGDEPRDRARAEQRATHLAGHDGGRPRARAQQSRGRGPSRRRADDRGAGGDQLGLGLVRRGGRRARGRRAAVGTATAGDRPSGLGHGARCVGRRRRRGRAAGADAGDGGGGAVATCRAAGVGRGGPAVARARRPTCGPGGRTPRCAGLRPR